MGELISIKEFSSNKDAWGKQTRFETRLFHMYFAETVEDKDEHYRRSTNWDKTILLEYPEKLAIHWDVLNADPKLRITIRRFVRDNCADVIYRDHDMRYSTLHRYESNGKKHAYRTKYEHGYTVFYFETDIDAIQFALRFADSVSEIQNRHPFKETNEDEYQDAVANPHPIYEEHRW